MSRRPKGRLIGNLEQLPHGTSKKFLLRCGRQTIEGFAVGFRGAVYAYVNRCCHIPISMDWVDNQFFSDDGSYLVCANHGAMYEPATGECHWGPCFGAALQKIPLEVSDGRIRAFCPKDERKNL
jgi:nitrite reductase/ring-hydroxylating ferredoxin subunit